MNKQKLMIVNSVFPPYTGGSGIISYQIAKYMTNFFNVYIFTGGKRNIIENNNKMKIIRINTFDSYSPLEETDYINKEAEIIFTNIIEKYKIDIIHFHSIQGMGANLIDKANKMKKKIIITMHDFWWISPFLFLHDENFISKPVFNHENYYSSNILNQKKLKKRNNFLNKILLTSKSKITTVSERMRKILKYYYKNKIKKEINLIKNGLPEYFFENKDDNKNNLDKNIVFGYIGSLNYSKGWHILLKAVDFLNIYKINFKLIVLTHEKYKNFKNIDFIKPVKHEEIIKNFYNRINCLIVPSTVNESFSLVANEAIALNKFLITSKMGALSDIKSKLHISYSPFFNYYELAKKMFYLIKNYEKLKKNIIKNDYKHKIEKINNICNQYIKLYNEKF